MGIFVMQHNVKNLYDTPDKNRHVNVIILHATLVLYVCYVNRYTNTLCLNIEPNVPHTPTVIKRFESI